MKYYPGDKLIGPFGHTIRIDFVDKSEVFYVAWKPAWEVGNPIRKEISEFCELVQEAGLELILDHPRQQ